MWKNTEMPPPFAARVRRWADGLALRSVAPPAAGRLQAEQAVKRTDCWAWLTVNPMADRMCSSHKTVIKRLIYISRNS